MTCPTCHGPVPPVSLPPGAHANPPRPDPRYTCAGCGGAVGGAWCSMAAEPSMTADPDDAMEADLRLRVAMLRDWMRDHPGGDETQRALRFFADQLADAIAKSPTPSVAVQALREEAYGDGFDDGADWDWDGEIDYDAARAAGIEAYLTRWS